MSDSAANPAALIQQIMAATNQMSDQEAMQRYQQLLAQLPREQAAQLNALAMSQLTPEQRNSLAAGFKQANADASRPFDGYVYQDDRAAAAPQNLGLMSAQALQQDPALVNQLLGGENSGMGGQVGKAALAALMALIASQMAGGQAQAAPAQPAQGGGFDLGSLIGSVLSSQQKAPAQGQGQAGGFDIGALIGSVLSSQQKAPAQGQGQAGGFDIGALIGSVLSSQQGQAAQGQGQAGGIDIGALIGSVLSSQQGQAAQGQPDLGSLLGSLLGGGGTSHRK
ncbi:MAG: hypothetical protein AB4911_16990 [Oscillochloridaceae bacterium umkhey_bin13]